MSIRLIAGPTIEPVSLSEAKKQLRVEHNEENDLISSLIRAARVQAETESRRALLTQTWELTLDEWPHDDEIDLAYPPLQSVISITYVTYDEQTITLPTTIYGVDATSDPGRIYLKYGQCWPRETLRRENAIKVRFVAGWASAVEVPENYKLGIKLAITCYYENRGDTAFQLPDACRSLWQMDRGGF